MKHKTLSSCFALSLFLHLAALFCFQRYSVWFSSSPTEQPAENWLSLVDKKERDQILKTAFEPTKAPLDEKENSLQPQQEELSPFALKTPFQAKDPEENPIFFQFPFPFHEPLVSNPLLPSFSVPSQSFNLLDHLPKDLIIPAPSRQTQQMFSPLKTDSTVRFAAKPPALPETAPSSLITYPTEIDLDLSGAQTAGKAPTLIPIPNLPKLPTLAELETSSYSDSFDTDLVFLPREEGKGYIFALTLIPRPDLHLPKLNQNITFLIDRANSIQQGRLTSTKSAIHKVLEELSPEDKFNIIAFDSKMEKMSPHSLPCTGKSYTVAEEFLEKIQLGSFFSSSDLYRPLFLTVPGQMEPNEIHTAILLTDGETLSKKGAHKNLLYDWTQFNKGKVTLFVVGLNDPQMAALDAVASLNRGKLINAASNRGLKRKLLKLVKTIQNPIAKNLACHAISKSPQAKINLYPKSSEMPHLYLDQPYVILGETDTLDDFILFVQGHLKDRWLNVKKTVSFLTARKGNKSLKQELAFQHAYHLYEQYVVDQNPKHIADAKALLQPYDYPVAFQ